MFFLPQNFLADCVPFFQGIVPAVKCRLSGKQALFPEKMWSIVICPEKRGIFRTEQLPAGKMTGVGFMARGRSRSRPTDGSGEDGVR